MDLTIYIKHQIVRIKELENNLPIDMILNHLERAELFYNLAIKENDENYYTDVIYRTNQVFEGALRIAYMVLSEKTEAQTLKKRTIDIEEYLTENKILKDRVLDQFSNYRREWRNPSTHDFKLLFSESESILAVSNVSAFTYVLLNQVIQKLSYNLELRTKTKNKTKIDEILNQNISPKEKLVKLLIQFNHDHKIFLSRDYLRETEVIGALSAYLTANESIKLEIDVLLEKSHTKASVDMTVQIENEKFIVEVKRPNSKDRAIYIEQMLNYLSFLNLKHGILYIPNGKDEVRYIYSQPSIFEAAEMSFVG